MGDDRSDAGISNLGMILGMAGLLAVLLIVAIVVSVTLPSNSTTTNDTVGTTTIPPHGGTTAPSVTTTTSASGTGTAAAVAACRSDVADVLAALGAYQAVNGSYPTPPAGWTAGSYPTNFAPLTNAPPPGPFLKMPPGDNHYVVLWDSAGHIWVEPPGTFVPAYDAANDGNSPSTCARFAR